MPVPAAVSQWLSRTYPKPKVDQEWLSGCYKYISEEDPSRTVDEIISCVEEHLLLSDFSDSMLPNTGFPANVAEIEDSRLTGPSILVEVVQMTEIGHSAFNLMNLRQTRIDRADLAGLERGDENEEGRYEDPEDEGPIPSYPRSMLKLHLSDGSRTIPAIEYRRLPDLVLGETPLGCKMLLKDVLIRRGMAFLEPKNVTFKGHQTVERVAHQDRDFVAGLRARMNLPVDYQTDPQEQHHHPAGNRDGRVIMPAPVPRRAERSPFREISEPPEPSTTLTNHADDDNVVLRRRISTVHHTLNPPSLDDTAIEEKRSRYFSSQSSSSKTLAENPSAPLSRDKIFSPLRSARIIEITSSSDDAGPPSAPPRPRPHTKSQKPEPNTTQVFANSDLDDDDELYMDDAFLEGLAKVEENALAEIERRGTATLAAAPPAYSSGSTTNPASQASGASDVIVIEDTDDKENIPVSTRRVRRRAPPPSRPPTQVSSGDIIDISD